MTYEDFKNKIETKVKISPFVEELWKYPDGNRYGSATEPKFDYIMNKVEIGGQSGGDCWGSEPYAYTCSDTNKNFDGLETVLIMVCPKITFLQFRKLSEITKTFNHTYYEYYGNYSEYRIDYIPLKDLYNFFLDNEIIES